MTAPVAQQTLSGGNYPSSTGDGDLDPEDQALLEELRPLVAAIVDNMLAVRGERSVEEMALSRWLVCAVCDELVDRGDLDRAAEKIVLERMGARIDSKVDAVFRSRWTEERRTLQLLVDRGDVFLRIKEAASIASCHERTIGRALDSGELPTYYVGTDRRVMLGDLKDWLAEERPVASDGAIDDHSDGAQLDESGNREPESSGNMHADQQADKGLTQ
jgi:DNA binding domain, excisionase family